MFANSEEASNAVCLLALFPGHLEKILADLQLQFESAPWTLRKLGYLHSQAAMVEEECDAREVEEPEYAFFSTEAGMSAFLCHFIRSGKLTEFLLSAQCRVLLTSPSVVYETGLEYTRWEFAYASAILYARQAGIMEAWGSIPILYWPSDRTQQSARKRALRVDGVPMSADLVQRYKEDRLDYSN